MAKYKFRLVAGSFRDSATGEVYRAGGLVESDTDLRKVFVNKFERLTDDEAAEVDNKVDEVPQQDPTDPTAIGPLRGEIARDRRAKLKGEESPNDKAANAGKETEELLAKQEEDGVKLVKRRDLGDDDNRDREQALDEDEDEEKEEVEEHEDYGQDISKRYTTASKSGLKVFKNGEEYNVVDEDGKAVNDKPLARGEVKGFIAEQAKAQKKAKKEEAESEEE